MQNAEWLKIKDVFYRTLDLPDDERAGFLAEQPASVRTEVEELIASHGRAEAFIADPAVVELGFDPSSRIGEKICGYELVELLGTGGMGQVFLAAKEGIDKRFGLKLIKRGMDTDAVLRKFVRERRILSRLDHPNIARLIDAGSTDSGLPYFVMEYVDGLPVTKYCEARELDVKKRLTIFQQICDAVKYAHRNLIVHRDLKPSNILVTAEGAPKLLDFGIAKLLASDEADATTTAMQQRMLTPEYASPEQIEGSSVTTATDVYSLGIVLYELLSGKRPFDSRGKSYREIADAVLTKEPMRPSDRGSWISDPGSGKGPKDTNQNADPETGPANPKSQIPNPRSLRGDLDNIILKALRKEPERRYQSVQEFSEDISRYLNGLPVTATADSSLYRATKFVKRNKIASAVAAVILLISGIAVWQSMVAGRERSKAEERFNQVRKLANSVLFEYQDGIENLAGSTEVRRKMINGSLEYLDNLAAENESDAALRSEVAAAYKRVGDIQGNPYYANLGDMDSAIGSYRKALVIGQALVRAEPDNSKSARFLATVHNALADISWARGEYGLALESYRMALAIDEKLLSQEPDAVPRLEAAAFDHYKVGQTQWKMKNPEAALDSFQRSLEMYRNLSNAEPGSPTFTYGVATAYAKVGDVLRDLARYSEALVNHQKAVSLLEILAEDRTDASYQRSLSLFLVRVGLDRMSLGQLKDARETTQRAVEIHQRLLDADRKNEQYPPELAEMFSNLGAIDLEAGNAAGAVRNLDKSVTIFEQFLSKTPDDREAREYLADAYQMLGRALDSIGRSRDSDAAFRKSSVNRPLPPK